MNTELLRVGDAERDEVTTALHEHFVRGRLTREELDERLEATLSARTVGDLRKVTRDLPGTVPVQISEGGLTGSSRRGPWEEGTAYEGRGPFAAPWPRGDRGPARAWGSPRGRPFGPLLLVALIVAAFTGGRIIFPLLACLVFAAALTGLRHARRRRLPITPRR